MNKHVIIALVLGYVLCLFSSCEKAPFLVVNTPSSVNFAEQGGTQRVAFTANRDWTVSSSDSWCKVSPASGLKSEGELSFTITCDPNSSFDSRNATVTIKAEGLMESITVTQDTNTGILIDKSTYDLDNNAHVIEIGVKANVEYSVVIEDDAKSWLSIIKTKALSSDKLELSVAANGSYDEREGKLIIKQNGGNLSQTISVRQGKAYGLFVTMPEYDLSNESHRLTVEVKSNVQYDVKSEAQWIKCTQPSTKGLVSSQIILDIAANESYDKREGKVVVKQIGGDLTGDIIIRQAEAYGLIVSPDYFNLTKDAQTVDVEARYNIDFDIIIPEINQGSFISSVEALDNETTKAMSTQTYRIVITENESYFNRSTSITFKQKNGSLGDTVLIEQESNDVSELCPYVLFVFSSKVVQPLQIMPATAKWTIYWGDGQFAYSPGDSGHVFEQEGSNKFLLSGSNITEFSTSIKGLELIDLSKFE